MGYDISYCIVCMNRAEHLKQTLPQNIKDNLHCNVEFVLLDYNSADDLEMWCRSEMPEYIESGILKYFKTTDPAYFHRSHSRNMAFRLASGNIICNLDADNFLGKGFTEYALTVFKGKEKVFIRGGGANNIATYGRILFPSAMLQELTGYDEVMDGYSAEDDDFTYRLEAAGYSPVFFRQTEFSNVLDHSDISRMKDERYIKELYKIFLINSSFYSSFVYYLFEDNSFMFVYLLDIKENNSSNIQNGIMPIGTNDDDVCEDVYDLREKIVKMNRVNPEYKEFYKKGTWKMKEESYLLFDNDGIQIAAIEKNETSKEIPELKQKQALIFYLTRCINQLKLHENHINNAIRVNHNGFGKGKVYCNFSDKVIYLN